MRIVVVVVIVVAVVTAGLFDTRAVQRLLEVEGCDGKTHASVSLVASRAHSSRGAKLVLVGIPTVAVVCFVMKEVRQRGDEASAK